MGAGSREDSFGGRFGIGIKDLKEELFIELFPFLASGGAQQVVGQIHEQAQVGVLAVRLCSRKNARSWGNLGCREAESGEGR